MEARPVWVGPLCSVELGIGWDMKIYFTIWIWGKDTLPIVKGGRGRTETDTRYQEPDANHRFWYQIGIEIQTTG